MTLPEARPQGPWSHRFLLWFFTVILALLIYWLLGFALGDISSWPGPDYQALEAQRLDAQTVREGSALEDQWKLVESRIADQNAQQQLLRDSTENSQRTMTQLLEFQRLNLQQSIKPSNDEQLALAESERRFLANQQQYQKINEELVKLDAERRALAARREEYQAKLEALREPIRIEYAELLYRHNLWLGTFKLVFLLPVLLVSVVLFVRFRRSSFVPLVYALGVAVLIRVGLVMHEYFPARYFKYILILASLAVVLWILIFLLRMIARPSRDWLQRQYREAYEAFLCPVCSYPIRRGPLRYLTWTRRSIRKLVPPAALSAEEEEPYVCPVCSTRLYEKCEVCSTIRPSLLPSCSQCGSLKAPIAP